jgi:hypothetical protein
MIDADTVIPLIQEDKIEGETLNLIKALGDGLQAETLNQACDRHIKIINSLPTIEAIPIEWIEKQKSDFVAFSTPWVILEALLETWEEEKTRWKNET